MANLGGTRFGNELLFVVDLPTEAKLAETAREFRTRSNAALGPSSDAHTMRLHHDVDGR